MKAKPICTMTILAILGLLLTLGSVAQTPPCSDPVENVFEIDENATDNPVGYPHDWNRIVGYPDMPDISGLDRPPLVASPFILDTLPGDDDDIFTTGGAKDIQDLSEWLWTYGNVPDKDDILHSYAALYRNDCDELVLVFGLDRYANNGDAQLGFWLFQRPVYAHPDGYFWDGTYNALSEPNRAEHAVGDLLVLCHFTNGGTTVSVEVFEWMGADGIAGYLGPSDPAKVIRANVYAVPNASEVESPWPYTPKSGTDGFFPATGSFFEGAVNITALVGPSVRCFSSFMAETRSSQSLTAQLKDFELQTYPTCSAEIEKTGPELSKVGDVATYNFRIKNTGIATLYLQSIDDDVLGNLLQLTKEDGGEQVPVVPAACMELAPGASCDITDVPYTVQEGDPDPLVNTVTVVFNELPDLSGITISATDDHSTNLFQPSVTVTKTADKTFAKVGETITYTYTIQNTSSEDSPDLILDSITDDVIGDLSSYAGNCSPLAYDGTCTFHVEYVVQSGDPDPLKNTVTVHYHPEGFPNDISDDDTYSVDLFQPDFTVEKTGDALSKIGDDVTYTYTITNTSSADSPDLVLSSIADDKVGDLISYVPGYDPDNNPNPSLAVGAHWTLEVPFTIPDTKDDPFVNEVTVQMYPQGYLSDPLSVITRQDTHSVNLFQPAVEIIKSGPASAQVGETITYTFTINNKSSEDGPALILDSITDDVLGDLSSYAGDCSPLAYEGTCTFDVKYVVQSDDPDPLVNKVTVHYHPDGFTNDIWDDDTHSVNLFQPSFTIDKTGDALSKIGDPVTYTYTITNTSSADSPNLVLASIVDDKLGNLLADAGACASLPAPQYEDDPAATCTFSVGSTIPDGAGDPFVNEVTAVMYPEGYVGETYARVEHSDTHSVNLFQPDVEILKSGPASAKVGETITYTFTINNKSSEDSPALILDSITDDVLGNLSSYAGDCSPLAYNGTCTFDVEYVVQSGDPDPLVNKVTVHYHPDGFTNDIWDDDTHSVNLFQPSFTIDKTGDALSKIGDLVTYHYKITNTSSEDSPKLVLDSIIDNKIPENDGDLSGFIVDGDTPKALGYNESWEFDVPHTIPAGAGDPYVNTVTVKMYPDGYAGETYALVTELASHSVNLFQPSVLLTKEGDRTWAIAGDQITYTVSIENTSSADSPDLIFDSFLDSLVPGITPPVACTTLPAPQVAGDPASTCTFQFTYTVQSGDPDPLINHATVHYHPDGFPNDVLATDPHPVDLLVPDFTIQKDCISDPVTPGSSVNFRIVVTNTGDNVNLNIHLVDALLSLDENFTLSQGQSATYEASTIAETPEDVYNEATATATVTGSVWTDTKSDDATCEVEEGGGATRTLGFWKTHWEYARHVFEVHMGGTMNLGWTQLTSYQEVLGVLYANNAKNSDDSKRGKLCKARIQASHQAVAALLNFYLSNGAPLPDGLDAAEIASILGGNNKNAIMDLASTLDEYNNSGDYEAIVDNDGEMIQHADPRGAKEEADLTAGDC